MSKLQSKESRKTAMNIEISCRSCFYFYLVFNFVSQSRAMQDAGVAIKDG